MAKIVSLIKETIREFSEKSVARLGASLAYYTVFSIAPTLVIAIAVAGLLFGEEAARGEVSRQLADLIGAQGAQAVETAIEKSASPGTGILATIIGVFTLILGASAAFAELKQALNIMWEVEAPPTSGIWGMLRARLLSFAMVLVVGFLLVVSLVASAAITAVSTWVDRIWPSTEVVMRAVNGGLSFIVLTVLFALIYKLLPDTKLEWRDTWLGAAVTSLLFGVGKLLIGLYIGHSSVASTYGAAGSLVVLLVWVYYSAQILLLGATFTYVFAHQHGSRCPARTGEADADDRPGAGELPAAPTVAEARREAERLFYPHLHDEEKPT